MSSPPASPSNSPSILDSIPVRRACRLVLAIGLGALVTFTGCGRASVRYAQVEDDLRLQNPSKADLVIEQAKHEYKPRDWVLYFMDRGMTLHLAGRYEESTRLLQEADDAVEALYTRHVRTETKAFLINDTELPYEGEAYEQVMINVLKALNYALLGNLTDALVEARLIDHRLTVLNDRTKDRNAYHEDPFARYLTGILYESAQDLNNAFIAYRNAYEGYRSARPWLRVPVPRRLQEDLLRVTDALHLSTEHAAYREEFAGVAWRPYAETEKLAQVVVISYNGRAPHKEDQFIDIPISLNALQLVLLTKGVMGEGVLSTTNHDRRAFENVLYGLSGQVVSIALPKLIPQPSEVAYEEVSLSGAASTFTGTSELVYNLEAAAEKNLGDRFSDITLKAVARVAVKYAMAEGAEFGAAAAAGRDSGPLVGLLVGLIGKGLARYSEEADKRSWRTLPDEIQIARLWVPPGTYQVHVRPVGRRGGTSGPASSRELTLQEGRTAFMVTRDVS